MPSGLVSIIIPTYNRAHLIGETLDSIFAQTYQNWECIIVDDRSTDNTDQIIGDYLVKDTRFQYHQRPKDRLPGGNAARNYGFEVCRGNYIQWFDSDDIMSHGHIETKMNVFMENVSVDYAYCGYTTFGNSKKEKTYNLQTIEEPICDYLKKKIVLNTQSFIYRKNIVENIRFNESLTRAQDLDFSFRVLKNKNLKGFHISKSLLQIRQHENSVTGDFEKNIYLDVVSEITVRKNMLRYLNLIENSECSTLAMKYYYKAIVKALKAKYIILYFGSIFSPKTIALKSKLYFSFYGLIFLLTNKAIYRFKLLTESV